MATQRKDSMRMKKCEICQKDAEFVCSGCEAAFYCTEEHQRQHWKSSHRVKCKKSKGDQATTPRGYGKAAPERQESIVDIRKSLRKSYYESFAVEKYEDCLALAKLLEEAEEKNLTVSSKRFDEFEYGATVCLLVKTYIVLGERPLAKLRLESYMKDNRILDDRSFMPKKNNPSPESKQFLQKKLNLISCLANLSHAIGVPCINLYILYTEHIEEVFGEDSFEASNCYFLVGCFYAEEGQLLKAIACFKRAAQIRSEDSGECFFNMGVLYKRLKKNNRAIEMFNKALQKRSELYGDFTNQVAQVHENIGIIQMEEFDFKTAMSNFEAAYMIRKNDADNPDFRRLTELIVFLYKKLDAYINSGLINIEKPEIFIHLKETIRINKKFEADVHNKLTEHDMKHTGEIPQEWHKEFDELKDKDKFKFDPNKFIKLEGFDLEAGLPTEELKVEEQKEKKEEVEEPTSMFKLNITPDFISKLSSFETYHLSELQLELEECNTQYRAIVTANNSKFLRALDKDRAKFFRDNNPHIFGEVFIANQKMDQSKKKKVATPKLDLTKALNNKPA